MYNNNHLAVAYASDDNYAPYMGISMQSLLETNQEAAQLTVFVLDNGIQQENRERLEQVAAQYGRELQFIPVAPFLSRLDLHMGARKISVVSYARLFLASIIPEDFDRVIYMDCDTLITDSLLPMWRAELGNALIAGVQDTVDPFFLKAIGLPLQTRYINAGVLLINLEVWRKEGMEAKFLRFIQSQGGMCLTTIKGC